MDMRFDFTSDLTGESEARYSLWGWVFLPFRVIIVSNFIIKFGKWLTMVMDLLGKMFITMLHPLETFLFQKLVEAKKKEKEEYDKSSKKSRGPNVRVRK